MESADVPREGNPVTVMFVDDEEELAETYAEFLPEKYDVRTAYSGEEALAEITAVDIVFLDRKMPGLSGDAVLDTILERDLDCQVAMLSGIDPDFEASIGYDEYLTKPVTKESLIATVEELVGHLDTAR